MKIGQKGRVPPFGGTFPALVFGFSASELAPLTGRLLTWMLLPWMLLLLTRLRLAAALLLPRLLAGILVLLTRVILVLVAHRELPC
jgi:hypothetical protein